jgi:hypothetical protein
MRTIYKYRLAPLFGKQQISVPLGSTPLTIQLQDGEPTLWCEVETELSLVFMELLVCRTGQPLSYSHGKYLGTWQSDSGLVYHAYLAA